MIKNLHEDAYFRVEHAPDMDVYRVARSARAFADVVTAGPQAVAAALATVPAGGRVLLDLREDPQFDLVLTWTNPPFTQATLTRFGRVAVLVNNPGEAQRVRASEAVRGFDSEDAAFEHLLA